MELATRIVDAVPSVEQVRLVNSGTEAAMSAIRLARGVTGRDLVVKFAGCYHGHSDSLLAHGAGSGLATFGIPSAPGVTEGSARDTLTVPFNDLDAVRTVVAERGGEIRRHRGGADRGEHGRRAARARIPGRAPGHCATTAEPCCCSTR